MAKSKKPLEVAQEMANTAQPVETAQTPHLLDILREAEEKEASAKEAFIAAQKERLALEFHHATGHTMGTPFKFPKLQNREFKAVFDVNEAGTVRLFREGNRKAERAPLDLKHDIIIF